MSIRLKIDRSKPIPLYYQLSQGIRTAIKRKYLKPGDRIPSQRKFMREYNLSYLTVDRAIRDLVHEGLLFCEVGRGTFVSEKKENIK